MCVCLRLCLLEGNFGNVYASFTFFTTTCRASGSVDVEISVKSTTCPPLSEIKVQTNVHAVNGEFSLFLQAGLLSE